MEKQKREHDEAIIKGTTPERVSISPKKSEQPGLPSQKEPGELEDAYHETEGSEYDRESPSVEQLEGDPAHSGVQQPHNRPGMPAANPRHKERMQ